MTVIVKTNTLKEKLEKAFYETISWCLAITITGMAIGGLYMASNAYTYLINVIGL